MEETIKTLEGNYKEEQEKSSRTHVEESSMSNTAEQDQSHDEYENTSKSIQKTIANNLLGLNDREQDEAVTVGPIAKEFTLDIPRIPSLELPLNVSTQHSSVQRAIEMCGGITNIKRAFKEDGPIDSQDGLELYLNKGDPGFFNEHPLIGKRVPYRDDSIILKITVPKGTLQKNDGDLVKSLRSLDEKDYKVTPVAIVDNTIKFRELSDFQVRLDNSSSAKEFENKINSLSWKELQQYVDSVQDNDTRPFENINNIILNRDLKCPNNDYQLPPPPKFSMIGLSHLYKYKGNPLARKNNGVTEVKGSYIKNYQILLHGFNKNIKIPLEPCIEAINCYSMARKDGVYPGTKKESKFYESLEECLAILEKLFQKRPIWIKRHIDGLIPKRIHHTLRVALALMSYRFVMGPWRNTYIKFGVDPRSSNEYAKYQTEYFKIEKRLVTSPLGRKNIPKIPSLVFESNRQGDIDSRFRFDGSQIPWYLMLQIDILTDEPNINEVYSKVEYLEEPNELTGWFKELDLVKMRRIMKYELGCLVQGNQNFNPYRLKYYKSIRNINETKPKDTSSKDDLKNKMDAEGDIEMEDSVNNNTRGREEGEEEEEADDDDDDENGIISDEANEEVLEDDDEEAVEDNETNDMDQSYYYNNNQEQFIDLDTNTYRKNINSNINNSINYKYASFSDIIDRIAKLNPSEAKLLESQLEGFVHESRL